MTRVIWRKNELTPQTLRSYPKAQIRQGADRVTAPAHARCDGPGLVTTRSCWARDGQPTNAVACRRFGACRYTTAKESPGRARASGSLDEAQSVRRLNPLTSRREISGEWGRRRDRTRHQEND